MPKVKEDLAEVLSTWIGLNDALREADEDYCNKLLKYESTHKKRTQFLKRIHSRLNRVRADRERSELEAISNA